MTNFADISHHNTTFDPKMYGLYRPAVALKVTQGNWFIDPAIHTRWPLAKGLRRIGYHYLETASPGAAQYQFYMNALGGNNWDPRNDIISLDIEDPQNPHAAAQVAHDFAAAAAADGHVIGLPYTYFSYAEDNGIVPNIFPVGWRRLWFANYEAIPDTSVLLPQGWDSSMYYARQYSDKASVPGVGTCDDSHILKDWLAPVGGNPTPPKGHEMTADEFRAILGLRPGENLSLGVFGQADNGQLVRKLVATNDPNSLTSLLALVAGNVAVANGHLESIHMLLNELAGNAGLPTVGDPGDPPPPMPAPVPSPAPVPPATPTA